ncbi:hypothetical protein EsH8_VII_001107 [Colletotrichum jinshuiense]
MAPIEAVQAGPKLGSFSPAIKVNGLVYTSGFIGVDLSAMKLVDGTTKDQTVQALKLISGVLEAAGTCLKNTAKVTVYLTSEDDYELFNRGFDEVVTWDPKPARSTVFVKSLLYGASVEIEVVAAQDS